MTTEIKIPTRIRFRVLTRAEVRAAYEYVGRELTEDEIIFLSELPPLAPPTPEELERMALRHEQRVDGRVYQRGEDRFSVNPHD